MLGVSVAVMVAVSSGVSVDVGGSVSVGVPVAGMHASKTADAEAKYMRSIFGPPSAVIASITISFLPAARLTLTVAADQFVQAPVGRKETDEGDRKSVV